MQPGDSDQRDRKGAIVQRLTRVPENLQYVFDPSVEPRLRVRLGERFVVETEDAFSGCLLEEGTLPTPEHWPHITSTPVRADPLTGPVYVEGVRRFDTLVVRIERIEPAAFGVNAIIEGIFEGPGYAWRDWELFAMPRRFRVDHAPGPSGTTRDGTLAVDGYTGPLSPLVGTIGVAPEYVPESSIWQGPHGGVWDHRSVCEGATLYFTAYHDGGLLSLGDMHGAQGDCEFFGVADETRGEVELVCDVIRNKRIPYPRVETADRLIQIYCYRPLETAVRRATRLLLDWVVEDYGLAQREAYWLVALNPDFRVAIGNMLNIDRFEYTVAAEISKESLTRAR